MKIYYYQPIPIIGLGYAQEKICQYLKEHDEAPGFELYKLSGKKSKPLKQLLEKSIVIKLDNGRYQLRRKTVKCVRHRNDGLILKLGDCEKMDGVVTYEEWYDLEEIPEHIKKELLSRDGSYNDISDVLEFDNNYIKTHGSESYSKELNRLNEIRRLNAKKKIEA